jgi:metal-sulfur cluster biosynthetic enzyme
MFGVSLCLGLIRHIHDPEHPHTIEELGVVYKLGVQVAKSQAQEYVDVEFKPTVPHCSLATLIGLCIRTKIMNAIPTIKVDECTGTRMNRVSSGVRTLTHVCCVVLVVISLTSIFNPAHIRLSMRVSDTAHVTRVHGGSNDRWDAIDRDDSAACSAYLCVCMCACVSQQAVE